MIRRKVTGWKNQISRSSLNPDTTDTITNPHMSNTDIWGFVIDLNVESLDAIISNGNIGPVMTATRYSRSANNFVLLWALNVSWYE